MSQLAETLQRVIDMPVWDRTGLTGNYYFAFRFAQDVNADLKADAPSLGNRASRKRWSQTGKKKGPG
jgi:uncharacterized protein (TIGR03435 family)